MSEVFPRRNLGPSENWGRSVEGRIGTVAQKLGMEIQNLGGLERYSASSAEEFARNAYRIEEALLALPRYFSASTSAASPSAGTSWAQIAGLDIPVPEGKTKGEILAYGNVTFPYPSSGGTVAQFTWPFPLAYVTSPYGPRPGGFHEGIDFAGGPASAGSPIPAAGDGVVVQSEYQSGWGNFVRLVHDVGGTAMSTLYGHMNYTPLVGVGASVVRGQTLGYVGNTGNSFGAHLHFETWTGTTYGTHADPEWFMAAYGDETGPAVSPPKVRLRIDGAPSIEFSGLQHDTVPVLLSFSAVDGRSLRASGSSIAIALEAISGSSVTGTTATLAAMGSFHA